MVAPWVIPTAITTAATVGSSLLGNNKTRQQPLIPDEIKEAWGRLLDFSETGQFGDFKAGEEIPYEYGNYDTTGIEKQGLSSLQNLLSSGIPSQFKMGDDALRNMLGSTTEQIQSQFDPFKAQTIRQIGDANDALKRNAAFAGNLYSTKTIEGLGDVQARGNETLTSELARLTDSALNRQLQAIPLAYQSGTTQENLLQNRLGAAFQYGGLTRNLNNARASERNQELLRRRQELQLPIQAAQSVAGQSAPFGVPSVESSPFADLLSMVGQVGGQYLGNQMFMNQYKNFLTPQPGGTGGASPQPGGFSYNPMFSSRFGMGG